jgi:hypothetical protein
MTVQRNNDELTPGLTWRAKDATGSRHPRDFVRGERAAQKHATRAIAI